MKLKRAIWKRIVNTTKRNKVALLVSVCNVLVLMVINYFVNNQPLFTGENLTHYAWMELLKEQIGTSNHKQRKDALFVNVGYDNQLVEKKEELFGDSTLGNIAITDRQKLLTFLRFLDSKKSYKYIFLDVRFEKGINVPEVDSQLFEKIKSMDRIVLAHHIKRGYYEIADSSLLEKAGICDYPSTIVSTNFVRYNYLYEDQNPSMPLFAFRELTGQTISKHGILYTCDGKLCYKSLFLNFPIEDYNEYDEHANKPYSNLGQDLLKLTERELADTVQGKCIVIGDMINDIHDTYSGKRPGSVITYYAFQSLMDKKHLVSWGVHLFLVFMYFLISLSLFEENSLLENIAFIHNSHSRLLHFILEFIGYTSILLAISIILNIFLGYSISIFVPSVYFAFQKNVINYNRIRR